MTAPAATDDPIPRAGRPAVVRAALVVVGWTALFTVFFWPVVGRGLLLAPDDGLDLHLADFLSDPALTEPDLLLGLAADGDPQIASWYPLLWAWRAAGRVLPLHVAWNGFVLSAFVLAASLLYGLALELTGSRRAALVTGLTWGLSGFWCARVAHLQYLHALAWLPLVLWAVERLRRRTSAGWIAAAAVAVACMLLAGHPQPAAHGALVTAAVIAVRGRPGDRLRLWRDMVCAAALGAGLAAVLLWPMTRTVSEAVRGTPDWTTFMQLGLHPRDLPRLLLPWMHGGLDRPYFGPWSLHATTGWCGVLAVMLALAGTAWHRRGTAWLWIGIAVWSLLAALGEHALPSRLLWHVPGLDMLRGPTRWLGIWSLAVAVLAGLGVAALQRLDGSARRRLASRAVIGAGIALGLAWASMAAQGTRTGRSEWSALPWAHAANALPVCAALAAGIALLLWVRRPGRVRTAVLLAVLACDLAVFGAFAPWRTDTVAPADLDVPPAVVRMRAELARDHRRAALVWYGDRPVPPVPLLNVSRTWSLPMVSGYVAAAPARPCALLQVDVNTGNLADDSLKAHNRALDVTAAALLIAPRTKFIGEQQLSYAHMLSGPGSSGRWHLRGPLTVDGDWLVFENTRALPRAWLAPEARVVSDADALAAVHRGRLPDGTPWRPEHTVLLAPAGTDGARSGMPGAMSGPTDDPPAAGPGSVRIVHSAPDRMTLEVRSPAPAHLVTADAWHAEWSATVAGRPTPVLRADHALRAVAVPAGRSTVEFRRVPRRFRAGLVVTILALAVLGALVVTAARRGTRDGAARGRVP